MSEEVSINPSELKLTKEQSALLAKILGRVKKPKGKKERLSILEKPEQVFQQKVQVRIRCNFCGYIEEKEVILTRWSSIPYLNDKGVVQRMKFGMPSGKDIWSYVVTCDHCEDFLNLWGQNQMKLKILELLKEKQVSRVSFQKRYYRTAASLHADERREGLVMAELTLIKKYIKAKEITAIKQSDEEEEDDED